MSDAEIRQRLNRETARIAWRELQRHYARGAVVAVSAGLDLIEVAAALASDDTRRFQQWLAAAEVAAPSEAQARDWYQADREVWAVVVAPWVLVQPVGDERLA